MVYPVEVSARLSLPTSKLGNCGAYVIHMNMKAMRTPESNVDSERIKGTRRSDMLLQSISALPLPDSWDRYLNQPASSEPTDKGMDMRQPLRDDNDMSRIKKSAGACSGRLESQRDDMGLDEHTASGGMRGGNVTDRAVSSPLLDESRLLLVPGRFSFDAALTTLLTRRREKYYVICLSIQFKKIVNLALPRSAFDFTSPREGRGDDPEYPSREAITNEDEDKVQDSHYDGARSNQLRRGELVLKEPIICTYNLLGDSITSQSAVNFIPDNHW